MENSSSDNWGLLKTPVLQIFKSPPGFQYRL
jgi:hypothetical protein